MNSGLSTDSVSQPKDSDDGRTGIFQAVGQIFCLQFYQSPGFYLEAFCTAGRCWRRRERRFALLLGGCLDLATELFIPWMGVFSLLFLFILSSSLLPFLPFHFHASLCLVPDLTRVTLRKSDGDGDTLWIGIWRIGFLGLLSL